MYTYSCAHTRKRVNRPRDAFPVILLMIQCSSRRWWIRGSWNTVITQVLIKHFMLRIATYLLWVWVFERNEKSKVIPFFFLNFWYYKMHAPYPVCGLLYHAILHNQKQVDRKRRGFSLRPSSIFSYNPKPSPPYFFNAHHIMPSY